MEPPIVGEPWRCLAADLRGTKPAPNGTDTPGQCTRELGQLGGSAANKLNCLKNKLRTSYGGIELLVLVRMGCLYCRLAFELPTQARQLGRQATRVLLMVMEPPRVLLMMMEPPCVRCRLALC